MIDDLTPVVLTQNVLYRGKNKNVQLRRPGHKILPCGSHGTVVAVWADGKAYEVEFIRPFHCQITIEAVELAPDQSVETLEPVTVSPSIT